jgi:hypothetical protein
LDEKPCVTVFEMKSEEEYDGSMSEGETKERNQMRFRKRVRIDGFSRQF